jgi:hypothetical protein
MAGDPPTGLDLWHQLCSEQSWDASTQVLLLEGWLIDHDMMDDFADYAERVAEEEQAADAQLAATGGGS